MGLLTFAKKFQNPLGRGGLGYAAIKNLFEIDNMFKRVKKIGFQLNPLQRVVYEEVVSFVMLKDYVKSIQFTMIFHPVFVRETHTTSLVSV